jgi:hypothetical protein
MENVIRLRLVALIGEIDILMVFDPVARRPENESREVSAEYSVSILYLHVCQSLC